MAVTGELESADEAEPDNTGSSNQHTCPYCNYNYDNPAPGCEHLLCTMEYVESNNELVVAPDHPIVVSLYGLDVPRVVAGRFMHYLRSQARGNPAHTWENAQGVRTTDLLADRRSHSGAVVTIKYGREDRSSFREWTFYLTPSPGESMKQFAPFVRKQYCSSVANEDELSIPFSRVHLLPSVASLEADDLMLVNEPGKWVMLTGLPDDLPLFFFSVTAPTPDNATLLINHSANIINRMKFWPYPPSCVSLLPLAHLPDVLIN